MARAHEGRVRRVLWSLVVAAPAFAEPVETTPEVIEVTELRSPRPQSTDPAAVTVLDRAALDHIPAALLDEIVRAVPSAGTFRRSSSAIADPTSQGLNLRGLAPSGVSRALVLRDGVPQNDPFGGWVYWRAQPRSAIERISIQPSGASALFGNFGLGGVMAIASRPIDDEVEAAISGGSRGTGQVTVRAAQRFDAVGVELDADAYTTDGYVPIAEPGAVDHAAASDHRNAGARVEYGGARAFARWFDEDLDAGTQFTTANVRTLTYGASGQLVRGRSRLDLTAFGGDQQFDQQRARVSADRTTADIASTQATPSTSYGASALWSLRFSRRHTVQLGADVLRVEGTSTDALSPAMPSDTALARRSAGGEQRFAGVFVQDSLRLGALELTAALRLDRWSLHDGQRVLVRANGEREATRFADRSGVELDPRLGALVRIDENVALRASVYRAFRAPTLNELYRPFQVGTILTAANEALAPETLWGGEAGPQVTAGSISARVTAFYNRISDPIFNVTLAEPMAGAMRQRQNVGDVRVAGAEFEASWRPAAVWHLAAAYTLIDGDVLQGPLAGKRLAQNPRGRAAFSVAFDDPTIATLATDIRYTGAQFEDDQNRLVMGSYIVVDALARRRIAYGLSAFATVQNLFDARYVVGRAGLDTLGQPRTVLVGVALSTSRSGR
jgi:outer membrane receptor protein involved in Fe transport